MGQTLPKGELAKKTLLKTYGTSFTRYSLKTEWNQFDWSVPDFDPVYHFDISIIDNKIGEEVLTASGSLAGKVIVKRFIAALEEQ